MKRFFCFVLTLALLCAAGSTAFAEKDLFHVHCEEQQFSTKIPLGLSAVYEQENGLRISVGTPGRVPFVLVYRRPLEMKFKNPANYLNNVFREYMENQYGDNMIGMNPCKEYEVGGKKLLGARYMYKVQDTTLCLLRMIEVRDDGDVEYSAKFIEGSGEATLAALDTAVAYYMPDGGSNDDLLNISVEGREYRIGTSTVEDFAAVGWTYEQEDDGVFGLFSPENESWFYAKTLNGAADSPILYLDMWWADGVSTVYQDYDEEGAALSGQQENMWDWLVMAYDAEENEDGALVAKVPLSSGIDLQIETNGERVRLSLTP